jgi:hypothetical protein
MASSGMLRHVAFVRTDVSEELSALIIRVTRIGELVFPRSVRRLLVMASVAPSSPILVTLMMEALSSSETPGLTTATWPNIPEDAILYSHHRENFKSYIFGQHFGQDHYSLQMANRLTTLLIIIHICSFVHLSVNISTLLSYGSSIHYILAVNQA